MLTLNPKKPNIFHSEHFKIEIRMPKYKDLDINDEKDMQDAKHRLFKELKLLLADDVFPALGVFDIPTPVIQAKNALTEMNETLRKKLEGMSTEELKTFAEEFKKTGKIPL